VLGALYLDWLNLLPSMSYICKAINTGGGQCSKTMIWREGKGGVRGWVVSASFWGLVFNSFSLADHKGYLSATFHSMG